jgi:hypothetical protein
MQSTLLQVEYNRAHAREFAARAVTPAQERVSHPPPVRASRRRAAEVLARVAWRLDREAALRVWP